MKFLWPLWLVLFMSCSTIALHPQKAATDIVERTPANETSCLELVKNFFREKPPKTLEEVLAEKKLLTFSERKAQLHYPRLEWINKVKKSLNQSLRNWNNFRYPAFYLFNEEEIVPVAKTYAQNLHKILSNDVPLDDEEITRAYLNTGQWLKSFQNYESELNELLEERISLQYNLSMLKKIDLEDESMDIEIKIKRHGVMNKEIVTLRAEDKNLKATINKLKAEIKELDGSLFSAGKIKERIIRQAMLKDILVILHRELEYAIKNGVSTPELLKELEQLKTLIAAEKYSPSTYGVFKIESKIFYRELFSASKLDKAYELIKAPAEKIKTIIADYFKNRNNGSTEQKAGILKRLYAKITSITPKQAAIGGGAVVIGAIGYHSYFSFKEQSVTELDRQTTVQEMNANDQGHLEQLNNTEEVELNKGSEYSSVIEVHIDELTQN